MAERLLAYAFGALHTALILLLVVALLLVLGDASALANIGTVPGIAIGVWLAALSWIATWWTLRGRDLATADRQDVLGRAGIAGFASGAAFIPGVTLGFMIAAREFFIGALIFPLFAALFAGVVGSLVGMGLAGIDVGAYALARRIVARGVTKER